MSIYAILGVEFFMNYGETGSYTNELGEVVEITTARDLQYGALAALAAALSVPCWFACKASGDVLWMVISTEIVILLRRCTYNTCDFFC